MEDFLPNGKLRYISAVENKNNQASISKELQDKILAHMQDRKKTRWVGRLLGASDDILTDGKYFWFASTIEKVKSGKCQLKNEFVQFALKQTENENPMITELRAFLNQEKVSALRQKAKSYGINTKYRLCGNPHEGDSIDTHETYIARLKKEIKEYEEKHNIK